ncbi:DUF7882 family protein [Frigoribacterium salinisoli]
MGHLIYERGAAELRCDDRTLAHLQIVVINKLRRREAFALSWTEPPQAGSGRSTIWLHPAVSLLFRFRISGPVTINHAWVALLARAADSRPGLQILAEPLGDQQGAAAPRSSPQLVRSDRHS